MRKLTIGAAAAVITLAAAAQEPLQCVNPDILNGVLFYGRNQEKMEVTVGLPASMGGFRAPDGFRLIGTGVRGGGIATNVAYKTSFSTDSTYSALLEAMGADGWAVESTPESRATFSVMGGPKAGTICRDGERRTVMVWEVAKVTYANIVAYAEGSRHPCDTPDPSLNLAFSDSRSVLPRFQFPAGTSLARGVGSGGGSNASYASTSRIISKESASRLVKYLADQIQNQGWRPDADWSGTGSAGSTWRKTIDDQLAWGTLEIVRVSQDTYDVDFTLALP